MTGFHQSSATQWLPATFKVAQTQEDLQFFISLMPGVTLLSLLTHHLFCRHLYFMCAEWRETLKPKQQHSCPSISQTSNYSSKRARTPNEARPRGSSWNRSSEIQYEVLKSPDETVDFCTNVWTQTHAAPTAACGGAGPTGDAKTSTQMHWLCHRLTDHNRRFPLSHTHTHTCADEPPLTLTNATLLTV